ncbi:helix-turn-helix domain-containing protein [Rhizobium sp. ARZ01]|uniref:helix-turn-helix domain-containing protein n=1 Tax=Rhizobium sp. ARZ01 TaxID=2769313 RepID=UPI00177D81B0|nr:helix-turn-helix domain-containing protein [Rhizobium sp. ARZ01]MBD9375438.1 helix-turn-helix domain-containing protein [Rhizobium sp. ARZ01]
MHTARLFGQRELREIGRHVRIEREKSGLTQADVADAAGMSKRAVRDLEAGRSNPTLATMVAISDVLSIALDALIAAALQRRPGPDLTFAANIGPGSNALTRTLPNPSLRASLMCYSAEGEQPELPKAAIFGQVLAGQARVSLDGDLVVLRQGDSLHARAGVVNDLKAIGSGVRVLLVEAAGGNPWPAKHESVGDSVV